MGGLIQQYIDGSFGAGAWMPGRSMNELKSVMSNGSVSTCSVAFLTLARFSARTSSRPAYQKINQSLNFMNRALLEDVPRFLVSTFRVLALCLWYNLPYLQFILRPALGDTPPKTLKLEGSPVCPPRSFLDMGRDLACSVRP